MKARTFVRAISAAGIAILVACTAPEITGVRGSDEAATRTLSGPANLIECPSSGSVSGSRLITPLGGLLSVGGVSISIPVGALLTNSLVTVTVPESRYLEVDISVEGHEHFIFELPVVVTMSYARCSRSNINLRPLSAWYIDSETKAPLENMGGLDNKLLRTVTFTTGHLSGYAIAN
ncbi:MAG TPA: hypothetical protein VEB19_06315 [Gemmatimonadaceae bacterium]|nr:hypothetical protein [Gemmatimonadaceae bacterium]